MANGNYSQIIRFLDHIEKSPAKKVPDFFHYKRHQCCIVSGKNIGNLPNELSKFVPQDEFWLQFNANDKDVMYYAFDVKSYFRNEFENEVYGHFDWEKLENQFFHFLVVNLGLLSSSSCPYTDISNKTISNEPAGTNHLVLGPEGPANTLFFHKGIGYTSYKDYERAVKADSGLYSTDSHRTNNLYNTTNNGSNYHTELYKQRSEFGDKLEAFVKDGKTSAAIDYINSSISQMMADNKIELIDSILSLMWTERLNIATMKGILEATSEIKELKKRDDFIGKFKERIGKLSSKCGASEILKIIDKSVYF